MEKERTISLSSSENLTEILINRLGNVSLEMTAEPRELVPKESVESFKEILETIQTKISYAKKAYGDVKWFNDALFEGKGILDDNSLISCATFPRLLRIVEIPRTGSWYSLFVNIDEFWDGESLQYYADNVVIKPRSNTVYEPSSEVGRLNLGRFPNLVDFILSEGKSMIESWQPLAPKPSQDHSQQGSL